MSSASPSGPLMEFVNRLRYKNLFIFIAALLILDLLMPDMIPMLDEIILGVLTVILGNMKKKTSDDKSGTLIEGEVVDKDEKI